MFGVFGVLALLIAGVGLYGVMAYGVEQEASRARGGVAATLIAVGCFATLTPALRATRVDPLVVLREE